jgi:NADPH-dependent curcumin reductase CurA
MLVIVMMPGVVAGQSLASVRVADTSTRAMRATAGAVSHGIVCQMAQRRGRRVEGQ